MRFLKWLFALIIILVIIYFSGPHPSKPVYNLAMPIVPKQADSLIDFVKNNEAQHRLKPDNEARIIWANDSLKNVTDYAIVYLHGFSASQAEGAPTHTNIAREFGCNLYLSRLAEHGIDTTDNMINLTPDKYWESAKQALAIGKRLGKKVILMGCSTGGTNALQLAAAYPNDIAALVLLSPNIEINNDKAYLLNNPWGLQIARAVTGSHYVTAADARPLYKQYWYYHYPLEATAQLQEMLETTMTPETFAEVKQPTLLLYYYKDDVHQDSVVNVSAELRMFDELGTPRNKRIKESVPNAGNHVIGSYIKSHDLLTVQKDIEDFMVKVLKLPKPNDISITTVSKF
jgi:pimeloyl-ACP methyl ester carboxylesterase